MTIRTCVDLHDYFRSQVFDEKEPFLWSESEVYQYMDDAQDMFCRLVQGIADASTPAIIQVHATAGDFFVDIDPRVLKIREMQRTSDYRSITLINFEDVTFGTIQVAPEQNSDYGLTNNLYRLDNSTGLTRAVVEGMEPDKLRLIPGADVDYDFTLIVYREPLNDITQEYAEASPNPQLEIDFEHRLHLVDWMKALAYQKQDADTFDKSKAAESEARFRAYCDLAKKEKDTREAKYRTISYGGIQ